ncbi:MAG: YitT family protein [Bavariicoccus seileri]|uniref:YitT family protein n=1 Tax=Bavariicoccus seileri TaxID=549685 RepID=A0A3D4S5C1_9ENTE|nr:YitT family protein [Bavariicoccus seileri]HCS94024.1 YitT family protein [Bavariicoccus seileri]
MSKWFEKVKNVFAELSLTSIILVILGSALMSIVTNTFIAVNGLGEGGVTGVNLILFYTLNIPLYISNLVINGFLIVIGYQFLDRRTMIYTILSVISYSSFLKYIPTFDILVTEKLLLPLIVGVLNGIAIGTVILAGGTTAGTDIVARIINKYFGFNTGSALLVLDFFVVLPFFFITGFELTIMTLISIYISGKVIDYILYGLNPRKSVIIISKKSDEIAKEISSSIERGITIIEGKGYYTQQTKEILYVIVSRQQLRRVTKIVNLIDSKAFFISSNVQSVIGEGFTYRLNEELQKESGLSLTDTKKETHQIVS